MNSRKKAEARKGKRNGAERPRKWKGPAQAREEEEKRRDWRKFIIK